MKQAPNTPNTGFLTDIRKRFVTVVAIECIGRAFIQGRMTIGLNAVFPAWTVGNIRCVDKIVHNEQIEVSVPIIVQKAGAATPRWITDTRVSRDICKSAITVVTVENIDPKIGHVKIYIAIVVIIGASRALSVVAAISHTCSRCNVSKSSIAVVTVERAQCLICCG